MLIALVILFVGLWALAAVVLKKRFASQVTVLGGGFIIGALFWVIVVAGLGFFLKAPEQGSSAKPATNSGQYTVARARELIDTAKRQPCIQGGTVDECIAKKIAPAVHELPWHVNADKDGYIVEKSIQIEGLSSPTTYRWRITADGTVSPVNGHAIGITKR
ncbi:MAG: hypothetical protein WAU60_03195 [Candidatus Competibacter denitrificans]|jgi:hypothetical protein